MNSLIISQITCLNKNINRNVAKICWNMSGGGGGGGRRHCIAVVIVVIEQMDYHQNRLQLYRYLICVIFLRC